MSSMADSLELSIDMPAQVRQGQPVLITLQVRNTTDRLLNLYLRGRTIAFDLVVSSPDGSLIWRRLAHEMIPAIIRVETLAPGEKLALEAVWSLQSNDGEPVLPGAYRVGGELLTDREPLVTPTRPIEILPG